MHLKNYYRLSFAAPLIVPLIVLVATLGLRGGYGDFRYAIWYALLFCGIPYLAFAAVLLWRLRDQPASEHGRLLLVAPIAFSGWLFVFTVAWVSLVDGRSETMRVISTGALMACGGLWLGYLYTGFVHLVRVLLQRTGCVSRGQP
ncbi:MAG: hypothetical protein DHS20C15_34870 [Planctomycetota bacterium]|nr:MAG: hypothetical protein DHS20C15_34870 [Planctomycetota bacterium]